MVVCSQDVAEKHNTLSSAAWEKFMDELLTRGCTNLRVQLQRTQTTISQWLRIVPLRKAGASHDDHKSSAGGMITQSNVTPKQIYCHISFPLEKTSYH